MATSPKKTSPKPKQVRKALSPPSGLKFSARQWALADLTLEQLRRRLPKHVRWKADLDYWDSLPREERVWLAAYLEQQLGARFKAGERHLMHGEGRREAQREMRIGAYDRRPDAMTFAHRLEPLDPDTDQGRED